MKSMYLALILKRNVRFNKNGGYVQVNSDGCCTFVADFGHLALYHCLFKENQNELLAEFLDQHTPEIKLL